MKSWEREQNWTETCLTGCEKSKQMLEEERKRKHKTRNKKTIKNTNIRQYARHARWGPSFVLSAWVLLPRILCWVNGDFWGQGRSPVVTLLGVVGGRGQGRSPALSVVTLLGGGSGGGDVINHQPGYSSVAGRDQEKEQKEVRRKN